jgi:hypothetical protein
MSDAEIQSLLDEAKEHEVKLPRGKKVVDHLAASWLRLLRER